MDVARNIQRAWQEGAYQRALALYLRTQIREELGFPQSRSRV
jgi:hypothetical protein